jgi:RNA polymerase sigma-70 factor (ECF subfamily)
MSSDLEVFEAHRSQLRSMAYRMLGDLGDADDVVQEGWLRWQNRGAEVEEPRAYLVKVVTNLCLNQLQSPRAQREETRPDRLPEPVDPAAVFGASPSEVLDQLSMALLVVVQRLTPAERAAFLLHSVFDFSHAEVAKILGKTEAACRQLLSRAKANIAAERRLFQGSPDDHRRLLQAFVDASFRGDVAGLTQILADDAVLVVDGGPKGGRFGKVRNVPHPIEGAAKISAFTAAVVAQGPARLRARACELNGQPAMVVLEGEEPIAAILLSVAEGVIHRVFIQADAARLKHLGQVQ